MVHKLVEVREAAENPIVLEKQTLLSVCDQLIPSDEETLDSLTEGDPPPSPSELVFIVATNTNFTSKLHLH